MTAGGAYSLRRRLLAFLLIPLCTIGVFALIDADRSARDTANEAFDRVLSGSALAIAERVFVNDDGRLDVDIPYVALDMLTSAAQDRVFYRVETTDGAFITGYEQLVVPEDDDAGGERFSYSDATFRGAPIRIAAYRGAASTGERTISYRVAIAETTNARDRLSREILLRAALRQALLIAAAATIVWIAVTRSLIPLGRLQAAIGRRSPDDLRPIAHDVPSEVTGLVGTINGFMTRLDQALIALRHFTGNASHQLRTPLAIIRTQLALAGRSENLADARAALRDCDQAIVDVERTLSQLLLLARVDETSSASLADRTADLTEIARTASEAAVIEAARAGFDLGFEGDAQVPCRADPVLLRELVGNLIDNAIKHAAGGGVITVRARRQGAAAVLEVEDDGCGIPPGLRATVSDRFVSGGAGTAAHSGLGLAIVGEIARLFGGDMTLVPGPAGAGLTVAVRLRTV